MEKKHPGQVWSPPTAADYNAMAAATDLAARQGQNIDGAMGQIVDVRSNYVWVKNNADADKRRGDVLGLDRTALLTAVNRENIWLGANKLSSLTIDCVPAVLCDPLPVGKIGLAQVAGAGVAYINVQATADLRARIQLASDLLYSDDTGPIRILATPAGTGEQLCFVLLSQGYPFIGFWHEGSTTPSYGVAGVRLDVVTANMWLPWGLAGFTSNEGADTFTCTIAGLYEIHWTVQMYGRDAKSSFAWILKNAGQIQSMTCVHPQNAGECIDQMQVIAVDEFAVGDTLACEVFVQCGYWTGSSPVDPDVESHECWVKRLSPYA